jgi:hypothetical protein
MRLLFGILIFIFVWAGQAAAEEWSCRNENAEIKCDSKKCEVTTPDGFTPTSLTVNTDGNVSFCAYTGCWEGHAANKLRAGKYFIAVGLDLPFSTSSEGSKGSFAVIVDTTTSVAVVLSDVFQQPMTCGEQ